MDDNTPQDVTNQIQQKIQDFNPVADVQEAAAEKVNAVTDQVSQATDQAAQALESGVQTVENVVTDTIDKIEGAFNAFDNFLRRF